MTLYVRMEIHPFGDRAKARVIGEMFIKNQSPYGDVSDYTVEVGEQDTHFDLIETEGKVTGFPRKLGAWRLLYRALASVLTKSAKKELKNGNTD